MRRNARRLNLLNLLVHFALVHFAVAGTLSTLVACSSDKKDDPKTPPSAAPAGPGAGENPHVSAECPEAVEGFYQNNSPTRESFRYFSIHRGDAGVLLFNQSPSPKRDESTDIPVNGVKKSFPENKEYTASCTGKTIRIDSFRDGKNTSTTTISFGENAAKVKIELRNENAPATVLPPMDFEKSKLPPARVEEPAKTGFDPNGCPRDILGKYASRDEAMYLKFATNEAGNLTIAASTFTQEFPAVELNNAPRADGDGTLTGECANGLISVIGVSGNGDVSTLQVKKESDKTLDVKKLKNGKTVKSDIYDKIR